MKRARLMVALAAAAALVATGFILRGRNGAGRSAAVKPRYGEIVEAVYGIGTVTPARSFQLKIGITTTIRRLFVKEGDPVASGSPLVELADTGVFRAPIGGTVTSLPFRAGETVFPQVPILTMMDLTDRYVAVSLEQQGALRVRKGQSARLSFENLRGQRLQGRVRTIFPSEGQFLVHIDAPDLPPEILPGMTADVAIEIARRENALLIPVAAVSGGKVIVTGRGRDRKVDVRVGTVDGEWAEVTGGGLTAEDSVLVRKR